jgi:hypothetical protein
MASIEGVYKATVQLGETVSPVLFILKNGRFEGFDADDRRFRGTYDEDPDTLDVVLTADISFWTPALQGEPRTRETRPFSVRVPAPPDEVGVVIAASLDLGESQGSVVIERLASLEFLT